MTLRWDAPHPRECVAALQAFRCTTDLDPYRPGGPRGFEHRHPEHWAYQVQVAVHGLTNRGMNPSAALLTGWSGESLAAVSVFQEVDGPAQVDIELMAISLEHRHRGFAREMCNRTLEEIEDRALAADVTETLVNGYVWHQNIDSQRMCLANGGSLTETYDDGRQRWSRLLLHARAELA